MVLLVQTLHQIRGPTRPNANAHLARIGGRYRVLNLFGRATTIHKQIRTYVRSLPYVVNVHEWQHVKQRCDRVNTTDPIMPSNLQLSKSHNLLHIFLEFNKCISLLIVHLCPFPLALVSLSHTHPPIVNKKAPILSGLVSSSCNTPSCARLVTCGLAS